MNNYTFLLILISLNLQLQAQDLSQDLLINYNFSNNYLDSSPNEFHGTNEGTTLVNDRFNNSNSAILFDGADLVRFPSDEKLQPNFPLSFSIWVKIDEQQAFHPFLDFNYSQSMYSGFFASVSGNSPSLALHYSDSSGATGPNNRRSARALNDIKLGEWFHLIGIYKSPQEMEVYYNSCRQEVQLSGTGTYQVVYTNDPGVLGSFHIIGTPLTLFKGTLDDFYVWDRVITEEEINILYNNFHDPKTTFIEYTGCIGDNYEVTVGNITFNESNPNGSVTLEACDGCDSTIYADLKFNTSIEENLFFESCQGSGFEMEVNGTIYNEQNPTGQENVSSLNNCDTLKNIDIVFHPSYSEDLIIIECQGSAFELEINNTIYNEQNPTGQETILTQYNCDSTINVELIFNESFIENIYINECQGSGFQIEVNGIIYNELNPTGQEFLTTQNNCDSIINIDILFEQVISEDIIINECQGSGFEMEVNGTIYNEQNPTGQETILTQFNCDSTINVELIFNESFIENIYINECQGSGFQIEVNGIIYNELNPTGQEFLTTQNNCDSIINIDILFEQIISEDIIINECQDSEFEIVINGTTYNEQNPTGQELLMSQNNCDSLVNIDLLFTQNINQTIEIHECQGSGFEININGTLYNESNPNGQEISIGAMSCDTITDIQIIFHDTNIDTLHYVECTDSSFELEVNQTIYNENNPFGLETLINNNGCDSLIYIDLQFESTSCDYYIPNIFSPNGDGINDVLEIYHNSDCYLVIEQLLIFDRWGNLISSQQNQVSWDGYFKNRKVPEGIYTYAFTIHSKCNFETIYGNVSLIR